MSKQIAREEKAARARNTSLYSLVVLLVLYSLWSPFTEKGNSQLASVFQAGQIKNIEASELKDEVQQGGVKQKEVQLSKDSDESVSTNNSTVTTETPTTDGLVQIESKSRQNKDEKVSGTQAKREDSGEEGVSKSFSKVIVPNESMTTANADHDNSKAPALSNKKGVSGENALSEIEETSKKSEENDGPSVDGAKQRSGVIAKNYDKNDDTNGRAVGGGTNNAIAYETLGNDVQGQRSGYAVGYPLLAPLRDRQVSGLAQQNTDSSNIVKPIETKLPGETVIKKDALEATHQWYLRLPVSPDFSSIDYGRAGKTGINIGLLGEFMVTKHISVSTGAIWSKKLYDKDNPNITYTSGTWSGKAKRIDGDCRVLDIPINVTYYIFPDRKTNLFVSVGSSSYIMLKENYEITVWRNQNDVTYEQNYSHENNEWFSMLNVSIGVQQRIGNRFMAQMEPFLKAPMSGVGAGKVNLVSTGVFLSLKYRISN